MIAQDKTEQKQITPKEALELLKNGNKRFLNKTMIDHDYHYQVQETSKGQFPFAAILSCIDSRVPTEIIFDKSIGDLFNIRVAGNIVNKDILGSIEFACKLSGAKLLVVLGHSECGAVKGACDNAELGHLTLLLNKLKPAIAIQKNDGTADTSSANKEFVNGVAIKNVELVIKEIKERSPIIKELEQNNKINIVGAMYYVETGEVKFFD